MQLVQVFLLVHLKKKNLSCFAEMMGCLQHGPLSIVLFLRNVK